jgi:thiamine pyrophosphokinase
MTGLIVTGGTMDYDFACKYLEQNIFDKVIAVDGGLAFLHKLHLKPDAIVGDFDTVEESVLEEYKKKSYDITWDFRKPEKDETDTELAIHTSIKLGCDRLVLLGATGGRMDHCMGNIQLLYACLKKDIEAFIVDAKNRIGILKKGRTFDSKESWGKYISFLPMTEEVKGITLSGFKYPLYKKDITMGSNLCISNELAQEKAEISFESGILLCIESHD